MIDEQSSQNDLIIIGFIKEKVDSLYNNSKLLDIKGRVNFLRIDPSIEDCKKILDALVVLKNNVSEEGEDNAE